MARQPSVIYAICLRFDSMKAIGVSRHAEKLRLAASAPLAPSTGRIHSDKTLEVYKGIALRFAHWARDTYGIRTLAALDQDADALVTLYLAARLDAGHSPHTLMTVRSALRMFYRPAYPAAIRDHCVSRLSADVVVPRRRRDAIVRSRGPVAMDQDIVLDRYTALIAFCRATGLRRRELEALTAGDVDDFKGSLVVHVRNGKGGKQRLVPVLPEGADAVRAAIQGLAASSLIFPRVPVRLDIHAYRRAYAQALYCEDGTRPLPPAEGRLPRGCIDHDRALYVSRALGHNRIDVLTRSYLR